MSKLGVLELRWTKAGDPKTACHSEWVETRPFGASVPYDPSVPYRRAQMVISTRHIEVEATHSEP